MNQGSTLRIHSIDVLRAITMLLMIFVNDLWTLTNIPVWLEHTAAEADGMGLADTVFPAFLFLVGMSIPLSIQQRRKKGDSNFQLIMHVLERSMALLIMGLFLMNGENLKEAETGLSRSAWYILSCSSFILIWNSWPSTINRWVRWTLKGIGIFILAYLAWICRSGEGDAVQGFSTYWWGILGLIGWAYLVTALIVTLSRANKWICVLSWMIFLGLCIASHAKMIPAGSWLQSILSPLGDGAMPAFTMGGVIVTLIVIYFQNKQQQTRLLITLLIVSILLLVAGFYLRQYWGISKIRATPAWVLICSAITIIAFIPLYWIADIKKQTGWYKIILPAGTNTLLCYLLPYFVYSATSGINHGLYLDPMYQGWPGLIKSISFSLLIIILAGILGRLGIRLRL